MSTNPTLYCPIRGQLKVKAKTKDGLSFSEEKRRIDCLKYLLDKKYPKTHIKVESTLIRFGNSGRNSFRTDIVVFRKPVAEVEDLSLDEQREQIVLIAEIKRDNKEAEKAKKTQVHAAMGFLPDLKALGVYWDDIEQKVFYRELKGTKYRIKEAPISYLPEHGADIDVKKLRYENLRVTPNLVRLFENIEDAIHTYIADVSIRYELLLQILLVKVYDEGLNRHTNGTMIIQDFTLFESISDDEVLQIFAETLKKSLNRHKKYLPKEVVEKFHIEGAALREVSKYISPVKLLESNPEVMQEFYMYFAKQLYKWDLAQYFTPYEVVDFIVQIVNPQFGELIKDPACGSADFLISAYRRSVKNDPKVGDRVYGADNSINAVQISVLNMLLNGDGKSNIIQEDSLLAVKKHENNFDVMLCNPPFGVKITEKRQAVLANFELGKGLPSQQTGILFAELVVRQAKAGGRIAIIVPNGYLGNRNSNYYQLRRWLLQHTRVAAIIGFPRFTFKKSGADVSASVLILEKRKQPLLNPDDTEEYPVYVNLLDKVGWDIGNKKAQPIYRKNENDGTNILNTDNEPILDADFQEVLSELYHAPAIHAFPWLVTGVEQANVTDGWSISIKEITKNADFTLDPKRFCKKYLTLIETIKAHDFCSLLDVCDLMPQGWKGKKNSSTYRYVEISNVNDMAYECQELKGWQLPSRAKHRAQKGDIFIGSIWSSINKWFMAGADAKDENLIVTNGFYRLRIKEGKEHLLPDLILALSSEYYRIQMRALATGSDGLAEIPEEDLKFILIPIIEDPEIRTRTLEYITQMESETVFFRSSTQKMIAERSKDLYVPERKSNFSQV